jgi:hypothetical protein
MISPKLSIIVPFFNSSTFYTNLSYCLYILFSHTCQLVKLLVELNGMSNVQLRISNIEVKNSFMIRHSEFDILLSLRFILISPSFS